MTGLGGKTCGMWHIQTFPIERYWLSLEMFCVPLVTISILARDMHASKPRRWCECRWSWYWHDAWSKESFWRSIGSVASSAGCNISSKYAIVIHFFKQSLELLRVLRLGIGQDTKLKVFDQALKLSWVPLVMILARNMRLKENFFKELIAWWRCCECCWSWYWR